ncbi:MAG TPA: universal stress protein [Gemmatimonadaceae bacterium]|nr:universal stress protein [Gemmatimonadaceae bacterium]
MFSKLLVPLDRSRLAEQALGPAAAIARTSNALIDVVLVHQPLPFAGFEDAPWNAALLTEEQRYVETIAQELATGASVGPTHTVLRGEPVEAICQRARDTGAELVVMTSHGRTGLSRAWLGSVADGVMRRSAVPVLMLRPTGEARERAGGRQPFKRILVPLDGSALAAEMLPSGVALAAASGARLMLLRVVQPVPLITPAVDMPYAFTTPLQDDAATERLVDEAKRELAGVEESLNRQGLAEIDAYVVVAAHVAQAIIDFAHGHSADVIAISTHGRGASRLIVGSVADKVLRASGLPMLIRRPGAARHERSLVTSEAIEKQLPALSKT